MLNELCGKTFHIMKTTGFLNWNIVLFFHASQPYIKFQKEKRKKIAFKDSIHTVAQVHLGHFDSRYLIAN